MTRSRNPMQRSATPAPVLLPSYLEVEIGTFCNRRCRWCPNGWHGRGRRRQAMLPGVWRALLDDLGRHRYRGWFAFHNYNEPLADPSLLDRIADVRALLPGARPTVYSNGDRLDRAVLDGLLRAGVREVRVTLYPRTRRVLAEPDPRTIQRFVQGLGLTDRARMLARERRLLAVVELGRARLLVGAPRVRYYTSRAGSVGLPELAARQPRVWPCLYPLDSAAVDVHGQLKLCCHVYDTTQDAARPYVLGRVDVHPLSELFNGDRMQMLRAQLGRADFTGLPLCLGCTHRMAEHMETNLRRRRLRGQVQAS